MQTSSGHLTYCTNIHAGENWTDHFAAIRENFPIIKKKVSPTSPMGIGLRLSNEASLALIEQNNLTHFKDWLSENEGYVFTMNGFPYGGFHHTVVKDKVHAPDWTTPERLSYTKRLFTILESLLPDGMDGGVSTSPMSYRHWYTTKPDTAKARKVATKNVISVAEHLIEIRNRTGKLMHLDIEPEPDGMLESGAEFFEWFENELIPQGVAIITGKYGSSAEQAEEFLRDHINLCYDVCHFAISYESPLEILKTLERKNIRVGKIQISAALKAPFADNLADRKKVKQAFEAFNENTYLHQVVAKLKDQQLKRYPDLPEALADYENNAVTEWRAHYHVPISVKEYGILHSTQEDIIAVINAQKKNPFTQHLEIETYTWEVMPNTLKLPLRDSIISELEWVKKLLV